MRSSSFEEADRREYKRTMMNGETSRQNQGNHDGVAKKSKLFNPKAFTLFCCLGNVGYTATSSYLSGSLSMIEKRFQLRSSQAGLFFTTNDIVGLCLVLFITYFGQRGNRPRILSILYMLYGVGALLCAVPHFLYEMPASLTEVWESSNDTIDGTDQSTTGLMCDAKTLDDESSTTTCDAEETKTSGALWNQAWWIFLGMALSGVGSSIGPLMISFLDDNQNKKNTPVYVGIAFSSWTIGIVIGFFLANLCLRLPVNFLFGDSGFVVTDPKDPRFLGAWWLGLIIIGIFTIFSSMPLLFFPRQLPGSEIYRKNPSIHRTLSESSYNEGLLKDIIKAVLRILTNGVVMLMVLSTCTGFTMFVALRIYTTKFVQTQFDISASKASLLTGVIVIPSAICGNVLSGIIVKKLNLQKRGMAIMAFMIAFAAVVTIPFFFFSGCPQKPRAGLSVPYGVDPETATIGVDYASIDDECNIDCNCPTTYLPICGSDGITYASPCHAGCTGYHLSDANVTVYTECSCILQSEERDSTAFHGECPQQCSYYFYLAISVVLSSIVSLISNPVAMLKIRAVEERDKSLVMGFTNLMSKLLAYIPGPVVWGALIDMSCVLFQESCGETGNCLVYDTDKFRNIFYGSLLGLKSLDLILISSALAVIIYQLKKEKKYSAMRPPKVAVPSTYEGEELQEQTYTSTV